MPDYDALAAEAQAWAQAWAGEQMFATDGVLAQTQRNADYYRGLVVEVGDMLGPEAYTADDGSVMQDVLCAKVPGLVRRRLHGC